MNYKEYKRKLKIANILDNPFISFEYKMLKEFTDNLCDLSRYNIQIIHTHNEIIRIGFKNKNDDGLYSKTVILLELEKNKIVDVAFDMEESVNFLLNYPYYRTFFTNHIDAKHFCYDLLLDRINLYDVKKQSLNNKAWNYIDI